MLKKIVQDKDRVYLITNCLVGGIGIISILFHVQYLFIAIILLFLFVQIILFLKNKRQEDSSFLSLQRIPFPVVQTVNGRITDFNSALADFIGIPNRSELLGKDLYHLITLKDGQEGLEDDQSVLPQSRLGILHCTNGEKIDIEVISNRIQTENSKQKEYHFIKDISKFLESERKLQHSEQLSVLGELAAGIAHEIRNPLTSLKGFLQLSAGSTKNKDTYNEIMLLEINRINAIVGELLLLSKPKEMDFKPCKVIHLIDTVVTIANTQAVLYNIEIIMEYEKDLEAASIHCEENKLKQVFINLLKNGIEAMKKEGTIYIQVKKKNHYLSIVFQDEGQGMSEAQLQQIGKRFYTTKEDGTGLGLMICYNIIAKHNGQINVTSEVGKGTAFEVLLPY
ncbi:hypothetical protein CHH83_11415 [Bacillus sp. 7586-K]|nr:hypothetical protein CHH83_11415 [Bacillus sp. 7586-K]